VFGNDHFGQSWTVFGIVRIGAVQKHNDIRILFDRTAFTKVCQTGSLVFPQFNASVELREGDQRQAVFFGDSFESSSNLGDLLFSIRSLIFRFNQLQIIDDHKSQLVSALQSTADGADLSHRSAWGIIDEQRQSTQFRRGFQQSVSFGWFQQPFA
jgi:hypothetical protein